MKKQLFSIALALCLCVALLPIEARADNSPTRDEAVKWLYDQEGVWHDLDNKYGAQCSDFVSAYMNWLYSGNTNPYQGYAVYNASYYPTVAGWNTGRWAVYSNTSSFAPEPGDIYVQSAHVGVFLAGSKSRATVIDQNSWETWALAEENAAVGRAGRIYDTSITDATHFIRYKNFSTAAITPTVTFTAWENSSYTYIRETDAAIGQQIDISGGTCTKTGMILYDNNRKELGRAENPSYTEHRVFFKVNEELGVTLSPGTTYQYRFWAAVNGKIYYSDYKSFKMSGTANIAVTGISVNKTTLSLKTGETASLTATVSPSNATDKTVTWSSSSTKVATVSGGKVTAVAAGTATITAKAGNKTATCSVTVSNATVAVTSISLSRTSLTLSSGDTATLTATVYPDNATDKNVVWTSDNEAVATVNNGVVTAVSAGTTIIRAQAGGKSQSCTVTVEGDYFLEVSAYVDGVMEQNFGAFGMIDVYINGTLMIPKCGFYAAAWPTGTTYEIKNVTPQDGYKFDGVYSGSLKGIIQKGGTSVCLRFSKDMTGKTYTEPTIEGSVAIVQENGLKLDNLTYTYNAGGREAEDNPGVIGSFSISFTVNGEESVCKVRGYAPRSSYPSEKEIDALASNEAAKGKQESGFNAANADGTPPFRGGIGTKPVTASDLDSTRYVIVLGFDKNTDVVGYAVLKVFVGVSSDNVFGGSVQPATAELPSAWAQAEVSTAISVGLVPMNLRQNYTKPVSRADVAQMFINLIEQSSGKSVDRLMDEKGVSINKNAFTDTSDYAVLAANALGIINGTGNSQFSPDGTFTRSQIAAVINRVARVLGVNTDGYTHSFTDVVGHWVDTELGWPSSVGIINGVGENKFSPDTELTTEQAIAVTYRALQVLKQ